MSQQTMTTNGYFGPGLFRFLRDLKPHNERRWFEANKQRYKADVQAPFLRLITDLAPALKEIGGGFIADPSPNGGSMMRIYRHIRFSKDKSPYKTYVAAHFWHSNGKGHPAARRRRLLARLVRQALDAEIPADLAQNSRELGRKFL